MATPSPGIRISDPAGDEDGGDGNRGRALHATAPFAPGAVIAVFSDPLIALPDGLSARSTCNWCLRTASTDENAEGGTKVVVSACTGCRAVAYCSKKCQHAHWKRVHSDECKAFKRTGRDWLPTPVRAVMQVLLLLCKAAGNDAGMAAAFGPGGSLRGNEAAFRQKPRLWDDLRLAATAALAYAGMEKTGEEGLERAVSVLCKIHTNAFNRLDADMGVTGIFLDPVLAMANHSCTPNAFVSFEERVGVLRAVSNIAEGAEINISYIDYTLPRAQRHANLELYHFTCACPRCSDDLDVYQVCQTSPIVSLNAFSLAPRVERLQNPPVKRSPATSPSAVETIFKAWNSDALAQISDAEQRIKQRWRLCAPLVQARMYAIKPVPSTVQELRDHLFSQAQDQSQLSSQTRNHLAQALALSCFLAMHCDPVAHVAPFEPWRVKGVLMIAKLLSQTAPLFFFAQGTTDDSILDGCHPAEMARLLATCDLVTPCEALLRLVLHWGAMGTPRSVFVDAGFLLADIESLGGREAESGLVRAWVKDPKADARANEFLRANVLEPIEMLAGFAVEIMDSL